MDKHIRTGSIPHVSMLNSLLIDDPVEITMGDIKLDFKPSVPVIDTNISLGRRHDMPVSVESITGTRNEMKRAGINIAVAHSPHAITYDSGEGNRMLMETIRDSPDFMPQFVCNPSFDNLDEIALHVESEGVRSIRMLPSLHNYPFRSWIVGPWLDWLAETGIPVWLPVEHQLLGNTYPIDPRDIYDTLSDRKDVTAVLSEVKYNDASWALPLVKNLPNLDMEISRFVVTGGITSAVEAIGPDRVIFGSRFPYSAMSPQLYHLHHCGLSSEALQAICFGNANRLLGID